jgi:hypothetical protein
MRRLGANVEEVRFGGPNFRDPLWVCDANLTSVKAQGLDWIAMVG